MNTVLMILVLTGLLALVLRRLEVNHARSAWTPWLAPLGSDDPAHDRDAARIVDDVRAAAQHSRPTARLVRPVAQPALVAARASRAA